MIHETSTHFTHLSSIWWMYPFIQFQTKTQRSEIFAPLQWRHNGCDDVSNHQPNDCLLHGLYRCRSKKTSKLRVTGLCVGRSPVTDEFPAQMASNAENVSFWVRHHAYAMVYVNRIYPKAENWATAKRFVTAIKCNWKFTRKVQILYELIPYNLPENIFFILPKWCWEVAPLALGTNPLDHFGINSQVDIFSWVCLSSLTLDQ